MTRWWVGWPAGALAAAVLLTGCSGGEDGTLPAPTTAPASSTSRTPPPIAPGGSASPPTVADPGTLPPSGGVPIPIPSQPVD